jgi:APA family basic amino acid/polyamine antiporter
VNQPRLRELTHRITANKYLFFLASRTPMVYYYANIFDREEVAMEQNGVLGLKRVLGLKEVVAIGVGQTIGAGVFAMTGIAIGICGAALPIAYSLAVIPVVCLMLPSAFLGATIPTVGGNYRYPSRFFSPMAAFMGVWIFAIGFFLGFLPLLAVTMVEYLRTYFPDINVMIFSVAFLTFFYIINILGIRIAASVQGLMVLVLIAALIMYDIVGIPHVSLSHFKVLVPKGTLSVIAAAALLIFPYLGANAIIELGGEIKRPGRVIPLSFLIIIVLVAIIYISMSIVAVGVVSWEACANKPLTESAAAFLSGATLNFFIIGGALLAIATTMNASFMWAPKSLMIIARDNLLPPILTRVNERFGTPHNMLTMIWIFSVAAVLGGLDIKALALYSTIGGLVIYIPVLISSLLLKKRMPERYAQSPLRVPEGVLFICVVLGILLFLAALAALIGELWKTSNFLTYFLVVWTALGIAYYLILKVQLAKRGILLSDIKKNIDF